MQARKHVREMWSRHAMTPPTTSSNDSLHEENKLKTAHFNWQRRNAMNLEMIVYEILSCRGTIFLLLRFLSSVSTRHLVSFCGRISMKSMHFWCKANQKLKGYVIDLCWECPWWCPLAEFGDFTFRSFIST